MNTTSVKSIMAQANAAAKRRIKALVDELAEFASAFPKVLASVVADNHVINVIIKSQRDDMFTRAFDKVFSSGGKTAKKRDGKIQDYGGGRVDVPASSDTLLELRRRPNATKKTKKTRRGRRRPMSVAERKDVSRRMKKYWAGRRRKARK